MSETLKVVFSMCMVSLALAALIVNSIGNLRADLNLIRTELIDTRKEVRDNWIEIINNRAEINDLRKDMGGLRKDVDGLRTDMDRFEQGQQALTKRVTRLEELVQGVLLPRQGATAKKD